MIHFLKQIKKKIKILLFKQRVYDRPTIKEKLSTQFFDKHYQK